MTARKARFTCCSTVTGYTGSEPPLVNPRTQNLCAAPSAATKYGDFWKSEKAYYAEIHTARYTRGR